MTEIKTIVCAVDFSEHSPTVAGYAAYLAKACGAKVLCLYVAPSLTQYIGFQVPPSSIESFVGEIVEGAEKSMNEFLEANFQGVECSGRVLNGYAAEEIVDIAEEEKAGMIVMGTHGRKGIDLILFGSVAEKVVKTAKCPVLTVRPDHHEETA